MLNDIGNKLCNILKILSWKLEHNNYKLSLLDTRSPMDLWQLHSTLCQAPFHISVFPDSTLPPSQNSTLLHLLSGNSALFQFLNSALPSSWSLTPLSILNLSEDTPSLTLTSQNSTLPLSQNSVPLSEFELHSTLPFRVRLHSTFTSGVALEVKQLTYKHPGLVRGPCSAGSVCTEWWPWL